MSRSFASGSTVCSQRNSGEQTISAHTHHSNVDYSLFEGRHVHGVVRQVFSRGELVVDGERWLGRPGRVQFQRRGEVGGF